MVLVVAGAKRVNNLRPEALRCEMTNRGRYFPQILESDLVHQATYAGGASVGSGVVGSGWANGLFSGTPPEPDTDGLGSGPRDDGRT